MLHAVSPNFVASVNSLHFEHEMHPVSWFYCRCLVGQTMVIKVSQQLFINLHHTANCEQLQLTVS